MTINPIVKLFDNFVKSKEKLESHPSFSDLTTKFYVLSKDEMLHHNIKNYTNYLKFSELLIEQFPHSKDFFLKSFDKDIDNIYVMNENDFDRLIQLVKQNHTVNIPDSEIKSAFRINAFLELPLRLKPLDQFLCQDIEAESGMYDKFLGVLSKDNFLKCANIQVESVLDYYRVILNSPRLIVNMVFGEGIEFENLDLQHFERLISRVENVTCFNNKTYGQIYHEILSQISLVSNLFPIIKETELVL